MKEIRWYEFCEVCDKETVHRLHRVLQPCECIIDCCIECGHTFFRSEPTDHAHLEATS